MDVGFQDFQIQVRQGVMIDPAVAVAVKTTVGPC